MTELQLPRTTKVALLDDLDYERLIGTGLGRGWYLGSNNYVTKGWKGVMISLHRLIMGFPDADVDHIDGDRLNNQRSNLRLATDQTNAWNVAKHRDGNSQFKGVHRHKGRGHKRWVAQICIERKQRNIGYFMTERQAAMAYDIYASLAFGEYARLNFPDAIIR